MSACERRRMKAALLRWCLLMALSCAGAVIVAAQDFDAEAWRFLSHELQLEEQLAKLEQPLATPDLVIRDVRLVDLAAGEVRPGSALVLQGGKVAWAGPVAELEIADEVRVIDGRGRYAMPGLVDMHTHLLTTSADYLTLLGSGVTTVREMDGFPWLLARKRLAEKNRLLAPTMFVTGQILNRNDFGGYARAVQTPAEARAAVSEQVAAGYDAIKIHNSLSTELFDAILARARELAVHVVGHVPQPVPLEHALSAGLRTAEHFKGHLDDNTLTIRDGDWEELTARSGVFLTPTFHTYREHLRGEQAAKILTGPEALLVHPRRLAQWQRAAAQPVDRLTQLRQTILPKSEKIFRRLLPHDVRWLAGTDSGSYDLMVPGPALLEELATLERLGLPTLEVLRSATLNAAEAMGWERRMGSLSVGRQADVLLLARNPLEGVEHLASLESMALRGHWIEDAPALRREPAKIWKAPAGPGRPGREAVERAVARRRELKQGGFAFNHFHLLQLERQIRALGFGELADTVPQLASR